MVQHEILIIERLAINTNAACSILINEVSSFNPDLLGYLMERTVLKPSWLPISNELPCAHLSEILSRLWYDIGKQLHFQSAQFMVADGNIEKYDWIVFAPDDSCHYITNFKANHQ